MAEIEQLRELLLKREQQRLDELERELRDREQRIDALGEILPASLRRLRDDERLQHSLNPQLERGIESAIRRNPKRFAVMFYPVIGPAIRRAVGEALKGLLDTINRTMEHSLSARSWGWRLEAWRSGVPFSQIVLKHTLAYSIDEVFLVQRDSGLLIARVARDDDEVLDRDAVAAMLTAIQRFMQESFATDDDHPVRSIELGEHTLWIVPGLHAALVAVIQGAISREARGELQQQLEQLHANHEPLLQTDIQTGQLDGEAAEELDEDLSECLLRKQLEEAPAMATAGKKDYTKVWLLLLVLAALGAWLGTRWWLLDRDRDLVVAEIQQTPGWVLMDDALEDGQVRIRALRDPLAARPEELAQVQALPPSRVRFLLEDYQSAEPELAIQRLALAAGIERGQLQPDGTVTDAGLQMFSVRDAQPRSTWQGLFNMAPAFGMQLNDRPALDIASLRQRLAAPDEAQLAWRGDVLEVDGEVPQRWVAGLPEKLAGLGIAATVDNLSAAALERRASLLQQRWDGQLLRFDEDTGLIPEGQETLALFIQEARALQALTQTGTLPLVITLTGLTDGRYAAPVNVTLRQQRPAMVREQLLAAGLPEDAIEVQAAGDSDGENDVRGVRIGIRQASIAP